MSLMPWAAVDPEHSEFINSSVQPFCCTTFLPISNSAAKPPVAVIACIHGGSIIGPPPSIENRSVVVSALRKAEWIVKLGLQGGYRPAIRTFLIRSDVRQGHLLEASRGQDDYRKLFPEHTGRFSAREWRTFDIKCREHGTIWICSYYGLKYDEVEATS